MDAVKYMFNNGYNKYKVNEINQKYINEITFLRNIEIKIYPSDPISNNNPEIQELLHPKGVFDSPLSVNEAALFIQVKAESEGKETILKLKGKLDNFTIDTETGEVVLNDLKTTGHRLIDFKDSFKKYHYNRQMAKILVLYTVMYISKVL